MRLSTIRCLKNRSQGRLPFNIMNRTNIIGFSLFLLYSLLTGHIHAHAQSGIVADKNFLGEIKARSIGPATMSGRISALDAVQQNPGIIYVGAASGGIWKSENGGTTFKPVFDDYNPSAGAITIDQFRPDTVWVGTGETWVRNSVSVGDGVYKTTDGGKSWKNMGLQNTERISKIVIHPGNPDHVYVAALGTLWSSNNDRGVYKTEDGGKSWKKLLFIDENTGCSDLAADPRNPDILYAGMWSFRRYPWKFHSGGTTGGLFKSTDGGKNWVKLKNNLPTGETGRISVVTSPVIPGMLWALIESKKTALYRSLDSGETWTLMNDSPTIGERPFYFSLLVPDTRDSNRIYKPGFSLNVSDDGGKTFQNPFISGGNFHSDVHTLWISGADNQLLYLGTDGGLYISRDKGKHWNFCRNLPISQFYHARTDDASPYHIYGGLQDNGSWTGPSQSPGGINYSDWENVGYGDGFNVISDNSDGNIIYWQYQGGEIRKMYRDSREIKDIKPFPDSGTEKLRFNWNTPLYQSKSGSLYVGSQFLFTSDDQGETWKRISGDLTTNDLSKQNQEETGGLTIDNSSAENHCTLTAISESPLDPGIIWAGTDDGNLQVTGNSGINWTNTIRNIPGLPANTWCSSVTAGYHDKNTAYATFDGHRTGDMGVYVYKTPDLGQTWISLADTSIQGFCHYVLQDRINPDLLFLGTESGLFISLDAGDHWARFTGNFPRVPVHELYFQDRENDLIIATHGRGIYIIDDITPLQNLTTDMLKEEVVFLPTRPFVIKPTSGIQSFNGDDEFVGSNPSSAVNITYYLHKRHILGDIYLEVYNSNGTLVKKLPAGTRKGINRVQWNMVMKPPKVPASVQLLGQAMSGPSYPPGEYTVRMVKGDKSYTGKLQVVFDPESRHSVADREIRQNTLMKAYQLLEELAFSSRQLTDISIQSAEILRHPVSKKLKTDILKISGQSEKMLKELSPSRVGGITGEERFRERLADIYGGVMGYAGKPTHSQLERLAVLEAKVNDFVEKSGKMVATCTEGFNPALNKSGMTPFRFVSREDFFKDK